MKLVCKNCGELTNEEKGKLCKDYDFYCFLCYLKSLPVPPDIHKSKIQKIK